MQYTCPQVKNKSLLLLILAATALSLFFYKHGFCEPPPPPTEYQDLYSELDEELSRIETRFGLEMQESGYPVIFGAQLLSADAKRQGKLLEAGEYEKIIAQLNRLKPLGIQAVTISLDFPALYPPFYKIKKDYEAYLDFYKRLSQDIRSRGMKLIIETQPLAGRLGVAQVNPLALEFCGKLKFKDYIKARQRAAVNIAKELKPDYLSIINEPDTETSLTVQPLDDPANASLLVDTVLAGLKKARVKGVAIGAGVGIWHPRYRAFLLSFSQCKSLNFIDLHVSIINLGLLERVGEAADIAAKHRKKIGISEAWLYKLRTRELGKGVDAVEIFSRDAFSFWEPLDKKFNRIMASLVRANQYTFFSLFWSKYLHAYLDYDKVKLREPQDMVDILDAQVANSLVYNKYTGLAESYAQLIKEGERIR
jgi:hypothetical protein